MNSLGNVPWVLGLSKNLCRKPVSVAINGKKHVMYRNTKDKVILLDSICPHRGADLSQGKIIDDCIQCPYHGWIYDEKGNLVDVPSTKNNCVKKGNIKSYEVVDDSGFLWLINSLDYKLPTEHCPELNDDNWIKVYGSKILEGNILDWIANSVDISHINYVHNFGNENNGTIQNLSVISNDNIVDCFANVQSKASSYFTEHMQTQKGSCIHSKFIAPNTTCIKIVLKEPYEFITFTSLLPIDENTTKMTWCFLYPKIWTLNLPYVYERFKNEMYKTVQQDENIIKNLSKMETPYKLNVPCDMYQYEVFKLLNNYF